MEMGICMGGAYLACLTLGGCWVVGESAMHVSVGLRGWRRQGG